MKIKSFKRQLRNIHKIVGLLFCITIVIIGVTGALYSYSDVITNYEKESYLRARNKPNAEPLSLRELSERFYRQRQDADIRYIRGLTLGDNLKSLTFTTFNDGKYSFYHIDIYSGDIAEHSFIAERIFWAIVLLHTSLDFEAQNATGRHIAALSTIAIIVLTITGLYFCIPMLKHNFSRNMKLDLKAKGYGFWYKLHSVVGVYTCLFVLTMCLTGLWRSYDWYRDMLYDLAGVEKPVYAQEEDRAYAKAAPQELQRVFDAAKESIEGSYDYYIETPFEGDPYEIFYVERKYGGFNRLNIDSNDGAIVSYELYDDKTLGEKFIANIYALHSGQFFGEVGKALWCVSSLSMALFGVSGAMMFYRRTRSNKRNAKRPSVLAPIR